MLSRAVTIAKDTVTGFFADEALTRAAGIAYFTLFSLGPLLFLASGIAGLIFGPERVQQALAEQLQDMLGTTRPAPCSRWPTARWATPRAAGRSAIGIGTLLLTASAPSARCRAR
jgi:membrane protein